MFEPMAHPRKHRCDHEIGVGVGTGNPMLDAGRRAVAEGDAQSDGAIVEAPLSGHRNIGLWHVAPIGVGRLRPNRHEIGHRLAQAAQRMRNSGEIGIAGKEVLVRPDRGGRDGHASGAGPIMVRLRHERRIELVRMRRGLHRALQKQAIERGPQNIGAVLQIDLELPGPRFLNDGIDGEALRLTDTEDVVDKRRQCIHVLEPEGQWPLRDRRRRLRESRARTRRRHSSW